MIRGYAKTGACATSFTNFLVGRIGLLQTISLMSVLAEGRVLPRIEELTGVTMEVLRAEWRKHIGAP
jgi:hypothetical protein